MIFLASVLPLSAQFWARLAIPSVVGDILHPPELGLKLSRVALAPARTRASVELAGTLRRTCCTSAWPDSLHE